MKNTYQCIFNGNTMVIRKINKKKVKELATKASSNVSPVVIQAVSKAAPLDAKAMRARLTAELFKSL